jgi:cytoskeleton protein RodZ
MSEYSKIQGTTSDQENARSGTSPGSAGQMLKQARLDAGLHIAALAVSLKVPVKRIEALEHGHFELLPDMVFVRALTSSICQALKIDSTPILEKLPKAALPKLNHDDVALNRRIGLPSTKKNSAVSDQVKSTWFMGVLLLCIAAAGIYFWPKISSIGLPDISFLSKNQPDVGVSQAKEELVPTENLIVPSLSPSTSLSTPALQNIAPINTADAAASTVPAAENLVVFKASGQTWVEVKNANGSTIFKKLLNDGDVAGTAGTLPLTVTVGRADATKVEVRGKQLDLAPATKNNVARFEVN